MKKFVKVDPWRIIEEGFNPENNLNAESIFSIGNGKMGQRANFEEDYTGDSLKGNYLAGIYYPDKTRVGWWKNGYPDYFAKVLNSVEWIGLHIKIDGQLLDLNTAKIIEFRRVLDMQKGALERHFTVQTINGQTLQIRSTRFYSMVQDDICTLRYAIKSVDFTGQIEIESYLNFDVRNQDSNYDENFWSPISQELNSDFGLITSQTKKTGFVVTAGMQNKISLNNLECKVADSIIEKDQNLGQSFTTSFKENDELCLEKYVSIVSSFHYEKEKLEEICIENLRQAYLKGFDQLYEEQRLHWKQKWAHNNIIIKGDDSILQAIRFNIFQLNQSYTGKYDQLNIGPKGFTGEKYGGSTYWDTEAYCLPYYLATAPEYVAKNLLIYRYKHLEKAIENAVKLGFNNGAALYPMVTMNGEECHNEWEITFEEIHRNGAIAFAIFDYIRYTGDHSYLLTYGLKVLISISRFWAQRVHFSEHKQQYVMHGVTGPNEYENNVNNNWYTSYIAKWCLKYTLDSIDSITDKNELSKLFKTLNFNLKDESLKWNEIIDKIYLPKDDELGIFLQQDGFLDKRISPVNALNPNELPLVHHWSWDRILRSCYIKQADVLQGMYFFEDDFSKEELRRNFDFYEPLTVHESSLSPCVHSILASSLSMKDKAYDLFVRTARLDLDDLNSDTKDGCHITSMAGTWLAFVKGFGGMRVHDDILSFSPYLPSQWNEYSFTINFRGTRFEIMINKDEIVINKYGNNINEIKLLGQKHHLNEGVNSFPLLLSTI